MNVDGSMPLQSIDTVSASMTSMDFVPFSKITRSYFSLMTQKQKLQLLKACDLLD